MRDPLTSARYRARSTRLRAALLALACALACLGGCAPEPVVDQAVVPEVVKAPAGMSLEDYFASPDGQILKDRYIDRGTKEHTTYKTVCSVEGNCLVYTTTYDTVYGDWYNSERAQKEQVATYDDEAVKLLTDPIRDLEETSGIDGLTMEYRYYDREKFLYSLLFDDEGLVTPKDAQKD